VTSKQQLTAAQWDVLTHAPLALWLGVSGADPLVASLEQEYLAFDKASRDLQQRYASNELVRAVIAEAHRPNEPQRKGRSTVDVGDLLSTLEKTARILATLASPQEALEFKEFLLRFGDRIARASSESVVDSRLTISQAEEEFLRKARVALGL